MNIIRTEGVCVDGKVFERQLCVCGTYVITNSDGISLCPKCTRDNIYIKHIEQDIELIIDKSLEDYEVININL